MMQQMLSTSYMHEITRRSNILVKDTIRELLFQLRALLKQFKPTVE